MKKLLITLCGIAVLSSVTGIASAQDKNGPDKFTPEMKQQFQQKKAEFDKKLNLSPDQKAKMNAIHQASKDKIKPLFEQMKTEIAKMKQLRESSASKDEITSQKVKIKQIREELKTIRQADFQKIQAFLTPAQQAEFNKMHEERKNQMESRKRDCKKQ